MRKVNDATAYGGRNGALTPIARAGCGRYLFPMQLAYRALGGEGRPIVILHGLFGSAQNWAGMGRRLAGQGAVFALDMRNHGDSPHSPSNTLADCVEDLHEWWAGHGRAPLRLIGHSLGGLVSMGFALAHPDKTAGVASVDIAPRAYPVGHEAEFRALRADISGCASRADVEARIAEEVADAPTRQFLATNAVRDGGGFRWRLNVEALERQTVAADLARVRARFEGEALLVACGRSSYVGKEDHAVMKERFPMARVEAIPGADHWPHITAPDELARLLAGFLDRAAAAMQ